MRSDTRLDVAGYLRQARRRTRMSQRELAAACAVSASTLSRAEAGRTELSLALFTRLLRAAGLRLVVVDDELRRVPALVEPPDTRDLAERRFPAHLDLILDPERGEWWGDCFGLVRPPETFHRDPAARHAHRLVFHELRGVLVHRRADRLARAGRARQGPLRRGGQPPTGPLQPRRDPVAARSDQAATTPAAAPPAGPVRVRALPLPVARLASVQCTPSRSPSPADPRSCNGPSNPTPGLDQGRWSSTWPPPR